MPMPSLGLRRFYALYSFPKFFGQPNSFFIAHVNERYLHAPLGLSSQKLCK